MKMIRKGYYNDESQLDKGNLPPNAVKFRQPESTVKRNLTALWFCIPVVIILGLAIFVKRKMGLLEGSANDWNLIGFALAMLVFVPHELIRARFFPRDAEVHFWYHRKTSKAFILSTYPISRKRFMLIALVPSIISGLLPLIIWLFIPDNSIASIVISFAKLCLLVRAGDYYNVFTTLTQVPSGAKIQASGLKFYWYLEVEQDGETVREAV